MESSETNGNILQSMENKWNQWASMDIHGNRLKSIENQLKSMGNKWKSMEIN